MAPGGSLLAAVWRSVEEMPVFDALQRVAERHVGPIRDQRYAFGNAGALAELLTSAGFRDVHVATQHIMVAPSTLETVGRLMLGLETNVAQF